MAGCDAHILASNGRGRCVMPTSQMTAGASTQPFRGNGRGGHCGLPTSQMTAGASTQPVRGSGRGGQCVMPTSQMTAGASTQPARGGEGSVSGRPQVSVLLRRTACHSAALINSRRTAPLNLPGARVRGGGVRRRHASIHVTPSVAAPCSQRPFFPTLSPSSTFCTWYTLLCLASLRLQCPPTVLRPAPTP